jgi:hypothetical protein
MDAIRALTSSEAAHEFGALNTLLLVVILGLCILSAYLIKQVGVLRGGVATTIDVKALVVYTHTNPYTLIILLSYYTTELLLLPARIRRSHSSRHVCRRTSQGGLPIHRGISLPILRTR